MVRAPRYGYWQRQPLWQEGERIDKWNPYYRQDLTGADDEISLEDVEGGKPPVYVPQIDQQPLGYKDVLGPRQHPWEAGMDPYRPRPPSGIPRVSKQESMPFREGRPYYDEWGRVDETVPGGRSNVLTPPPKTEEDLRWIPGPREDPNIPMSSLSPGVQLASSLQDRPGGYMPSGGYLTEPEAGRFMRGDPYIEWNRGFRTPDPRRRQNPIDYYPDLPADDPTLRLSSREGGTQLALSENLPPADLLEQIGKTYNNPLNRALRWGQGILNGQPENPPLPFNGNLPRPRPPQRQDVGETTGTYGGPTDLIAPPDKPQQDTQSVAAVFGGPQSGASSMLEDPRGETSRKRYDAARIAREAFSRDPSLVKEFLPKLRDAGVDPGLGAPEGWSLPEAPETWQTPGFGTETEAERAARRAEQEAAYRRDTFPPGTGIPGPAVPGGPRPGEPLIMPPRGAAAPQDAGSIADIFGGGGAGPSNPLSPDYSIGGGMTPGNFGRAPQPRPEEFGPYEGIPGQVADLRNGPRDITRGLIAGGQEARLPRPRPNTDTQFAMLPNGPREWSLGIQTPGGQQSRLPQNRPPIPSDPPIPSELIASADRFANANLDTENPALTDEVRVRQGQRAVAPQPYDPLSSIRLPLIQQTAQRAPAPAPASPIDPAAIAEARQTLQLHPNAGRIRTAPGYQQYNEPARTRPVPAQAEAPWIRDLEAERNSPEVRARVAAEASQIARMPRPRPEQFGPPMPEEAIGSDVPGPQSGLPTSVMESIYHPNYNPTAMGGPAEEEVARRAIINQQPSQQPYVEDWIDEIAGPEVTAPPPAPPPITEQQVIDDRPRLIASSSAYAGPTAKSRRTGFLGNVFDRKHFVGGPGLTASPSTVGTDYTKSAKPGRGKYKPAEHERLARNIGKTAGLVTSAVTGAPLTATMPLFGMGGAMINRAIDPNRQVIERGPFRFFGGIFGRGKDKKKNDANGTPPMDTRPAGVAESMGGNRGGGDSRGSVGGYGYGSGYGYGGAPYPGYGGYGYGPGPDSIGGAYRNL